MSCGCLRYKNNPRTKDLTGCTFGELTVLCRIKNNRKNRSVYWLCSCSCGNIYEVSSSRLTTGARTHCGNKIHRKNFPKADITGKKFYKLTVLYSTDKRDSKGSVIWHCRCDCGREKEFSHNELIYSNIKSCGCLRKEYDMRLKESLTHVSGTSVDLLKSKKLPSNNTTGYKGVYLIKDRYLAKIVFQGKAYHLGFFYDIKEAIDARKKAERILFDSTTAFYERWKVKAIADPVWADNNPIQIHVTKNSEHGLQISFLPIF